MYSHRARAITASTRAVPQSLCTCLQVGIGCRAGLQRRLATWPHVAPRNEAPRNVSRSVAARRRHGHPVCKPQSPCAAQAHRADIRCLRSALKTQPRARRPDVCGRTYVTSRHGLVPDVFVLSLRCERLCPTACELWACTGFFRTVQRSCVSTRLASGT